jgi:hypothetical protein
MHDKTDSPADLVFYGFVVDRNDTVISVEVAPGTVVELQTRDVQKIEEAADTATKRSYVRAILKPDSEFTARVTPKLARLAARAQGVPFALGGSGFAPEGASDLPGAATPATTTAALISQGDRGGFVISANCRQTTLRIREVATRCRRLFLGWLNDDTQTITYSTCDDFWFA